jgi:membrane protease subunit HflK
LDRAERTAFISFLTHAGLVALTASLAFLSGSAAVLSLSLLVSAGLAGSGLAWAGRLSSHGRRSFPQVPWNLALAAVGAGVLLASAAFARAPASRAVEILVPSLVACAAAAAVLAVLAGRERAVGRETDSRGLMASGACSWLSAAGAALATAGLAAERAGVALDRTASLAVTVLAAAIGAGMLAGAVRGLLTGRAAEGAFHVRIGRARALDGRRRGRTLGSRVRRAGDEIVHPAHRRRTACVAAAVALGAWALTAISFVGPYQVAVVSGRGAVREAGPGLLVTLPWPIERVERADAGGVLRSSVGRDEPPALRERALAGGLSRVAASLGVPVREAALAKPPSVERVFLTGDGWFVAVEATAHYRVADHAAFRTAAVDADAVVEKALESAVAGVVAARPLDALVSGDRRSVEEIVRLDLSAALGGLSLGVEVLGVQMARVLPPEDARGALGAPAVARDDAERAVIVASERAAAALSAARLESFEAVASAKRYAADRVRLAERDAARFGALAAEHRRARPVVETRMAFETIDALLAGREKWILGEKAAVEGLDPAPCDSALSLARAWTK